MLSNLTPIVSLWIPKNVQDLLPDSHVLPNTFKFPYRDNFISCARQNPERKMIFIALTTGLIPEQAERAKNIERKSPNIVFMPLENINFGEYDLSMKIEDDIMPFSDYLKNRHNIKKEAKLPLAIEIDLVRIILGLKGCEFLLEAGISKDELPEEKSLIISDLDILPQEEIRDAKLGEDIALAEVAYECKLLENGLLVVRKPEHAALSGLYKFIQDSSFNWQNMNPNMIYIGQLLALTKYFNGNVKISTYEEIISYLEHGKGVILHRNGADKVINFPDFQKMMQSRRCEFTYNNGKKFTYPDIKLNSTKGWPENLYHTEAEEFKLKQAFLSKEPTRAEKALLSILYKGFDNKFRNEYGMTDWRRFSSHIKSVYENLEKCGLLCHPDLREVFNKMLERFFVETGSIHEELDFKITVLDHLLQDDRNRNAEYIINILCLLKPRPYYSDGRTLETYFNLLLKHNMLKDHDNRNKLLHTLAFKGKDEDLSFSYTIRKLTRILTESKKFTSEEVSDICSYVEKEKENVPTTKFGNISVNRESCLGNPPLDKASNHI